MLNELLEHLPHVIEHAIMITGFVFVMMLVIEFVNVQTQVFGKKSFLQKGWNQYIFAGILGIIPGCLGAFSAVGLFSHGILSFGALVTTMIATSGDEAFLMLAMFPGKAAFLFVLLLIIGVFSGKAVDKFLPSKFQTKKFADQKLPIHEGEKCLCFSGKDFLKNFSFRRIIILVLVALVITFSITSLVKKGHNTHEHAQEQVHKHSEDNEHHLEPDEEYLGHPNHVEEHSEEHDEDCEHAVHEEGKHEEGAWAYITILITAVIAFFLVLASTEHFLKEHLWDHIVKVHIIKIFFWSLGTLVAVHLLMHYVDFNSWISENQLILLLIAGIIGLIPESGPHLIFVTLFFEGSIPFSILLASSIVQDGHGMLPLLAESKRSYISVKVINLIVGLIIGFVLLKAGF
jgi:hypothetical protein